jgi:hypothetical protein
LFDALSDSVYPFVQKYTRPDGSLLWRDAWPGRDGLDDAYESFVNWPLLYLLGGGDHLLPLAARQWEAVTRQFTAYGQVYREYERGYDWFHQGEGNLFFYNLCLAAPDAERWRERARRFAGLYLNEDPKAPNYDAERKLIRAAHTGSGGPRLTPYAFSYPFTEGEAVYRYTPRHEPFGLPYDDVPGVTRLHDLKDPALARRMGQVMNERMLRGDVAVNLGATGLMTTAYLLTGDEKCRRWVVEYVDAWMERARQNGGLVPDNVGTSGTVGEYLGGRWYGGLYGWAWPHGLSPIASAVTVAASCALLLTGDEGYLDLPRQLLERVLERAEVRGGRLVVPHRHNDAGWFDYGPLPLRFPAALWNLSMAAGDWDRLERLRRAESRDWQAASRSRSRFEDAHTAPWLRYLAGDNPTYPETVLAEALAQVQWKLDQIRVDDWDLTQVHIHHWQIMNPVTTEALVQLTLGGPPAIYNGGLPFVRLRYFDAVASRPGLPPDVAALVEKVEATRTVVHLVNLSALHARTVVVQAGAFGEHRFTGVRFTEIQDEAAYPGPTGSTTDLEGTLGNRPRPEPATAWHSARVDGSQLAVHLPPGKTITLDLGTARFARPAPTIFARG